MSEEFFTEVPDKVGLGGLESTDPYTYKVYDPDRMVLGNRMEEHLRIAVCYWHSFNWPGSDFFGVGTFDRPWGGGARAPHPPPPPQGAPPRELVGQRGVGVVLLEQDDKAPPGHTDCAAAADI